MSYPKKLSTEECQDVIAKKHGYVNWKSLENYCIDELSRSKFYLSQYIREVAELYAEQTSSKQTMYWIREHDKLVDINQHLVKQLESNPDIIIPTELIPRDEILSEIEGCYANGIKKPEQVAKYIYDLIGIYFNSFTGKLPIRK